MVKNMLGSMLLPKQEQPARADTGHPEYLRLQQIGKQSLFHHVYLFGEKSCTNTKYQACGVLPLA
jgi:hypothetical protein